MRAQPLLLVVGRRHFLVVRGQPQRAAGVPGAVCRHRAGPLPPYAKRMAAERKFGGIVVHDHQMAHARGRGTAPAVVEHQHVQPGTCQLVRAGRADDAGTDDDDVCIHGQTWER